MIVLGLCTMGSSSAALVINGELIAAVEEERLTRLKNDGSFPIESIKECLRIANISIEEVNVIAIYWQPSRIWTRLTGTFKKLFSLNASRIGISHQIKRHFSPNFNRESNENLQDKSGKWIDLFYVRKIIKNKIGSYSGKIKFFDHHICHMNYVDAIRNWENCVLLSYDGGGEEYSTVIGIKTNNELRNIRNVKWPNSLGHYYSFFTGFLGFKMNEGEYKMMGLAPYGEPIYKDLILEKVLKLIENGNYQFNYNLCDYHLALRGLFNDSLIELFGTPRKKDEELTKDHINLATSVQFAFEECLKHILKFAKTFDESLNRLAISGGCALNVSANGRILEQELFKEIIIPPAPHDAGCAVGAAITELKSENINVEINSSFKDPYLGSNYTNSEIEKVFSDMNLPKPNELSDSDLVELVSNSLSKGEIVCWFQGRSEFGPRALGARSFLADPRNDNIREKLNEKIKKREPFRPFAPSITYEAVSDYFHIDQESPYMNIVAKVRNDKIDVIPAVVHIDKTARVHTVTYKSNKLYYQLLKGFENLTGVPVLLNTSFNIQEPIVYSPEDAIKTYLNSDVDILAIGNYVCDKKWKNSVK